MSLLIIVGKNIQQMTVPGNDEKIPDKIINSDITL